MYVVFPKKSQLDKMGLTNAWTIKLDVPTKKDFAIELDDNVEVLATF